MTIKEIVAILKLNMPKQTMRVYLMQHLVRQYMRLLLASAEQKLNECE